MATQRIEVGVVLEPFAARESQLGAAIEAVERFLDFAHVGKSTGDVIGDGGDPPAP